MNALLIPRTCQRPRYGCDARPGNRFNGTGGSPHRVYKPEHERLLDVYFAMDPSPENAPARIALLERINGRSAVAHSETE